MLDALKKIRFVLVKPTHPGNIGATARAMKTMGLENLAIVSPECDPFDRQAIARASGADDLLHNALITDSLVTALEGVHYVAGTSGRTRSLPWPLISPREVAPVIAQKAQEGITAVLFGRERDGLSNDELQLCHKHVCIPTSEFKSLNLAQAVQIMAYECRYQLLTTEAEQAPVEECHQAASMDKLDGMVTHWETVMTAVNFLNPDHPKAT